MKSKFFENLAILPSGHLQKGQIVVIAENNLKTTQTKVWLVEDF